VAACPGHRGTHIAHDRLARYVWVTAHSRQICISAVLMLTHGFDEAGPFASRHDAWGGRMLDAYSGYRSGRTERGCKMDASERRTAQRCQVRVGEECRLCVPGASGPEDCGLAYLVMTDPGLRSELARRQRDNDVEWDS